MDRQMLLWIYYKSMHQKDERFRILEQQHLGGGAARNLGLKEAEGEYLSF